MVQCLLHCTKASIMIYGFVTLDTLCPFWTDLPLFSCGVIILVIIIIVTAFPTGSTNDNSGNSKASNSRVETEIENPLFGPWPSGHPFDLVARCDRTRDNLLLLQ